MVLPINTQDAHSSTSTSQANRVPVIFRRLGRWQQMDFELAAWQLTYLCIAPRRVYRNVYFHKQTKNTWARDDPAILVLIAACLCVSSTAWAIVYASSPLQAFWLSLTFSFLMIARDFFLSGLVISTVLHFTANKLLLAPTPTHIFPPSTPDSQHHSSLNSRSAHQSLSFTTQQSATPQAVNKVEWAYVFDVHTNAFFPFFLTLYIAQLFLLPIVLRDNWVCLFLGNTLWAVAVGQYIYGVYLGLNALPFLVRSELLLSPLLPLFVAYVLSLLGFNIAKHVLAVYFGAVGMSSGGGGGSD